MLGITVLLDISARLTPQITNNNYFSSQGKNIIKKRKKKENTKIWED